MTFSNRLLWMAVGVALGSADAGSAQTPRPGGTPTRSVYVQDFEAHTGDATGGGGSSRQGPLSVLRGARSTAKATMSAGSLSSAIADEFESRGYTSERIARDVSLPKQGWLVTGIFYAIDRQGLVRMPTFVSGQPDPVNTQITVSVADLAVDPGAPFIVFGNAEALRGQGPPAGWNPYVVAARFVIGQVESAIDIQKLAAQIVDTILENKQVIEERAPARKP